MDSVTFWGCTLKLLGILLKKGEAEKKNPLKNEFQGRCLISSIHIIGIWLIPCFHGIRITLENQCFLKISSLADRSAFVHF